MDERVPALVAGIDASDLAVMEPGLHAAGFAVTNVSRGIDVADTGAHVGLVILELSLADMDGVDVIRRLRARSHVPIIVCTTRTERTDRLAALYAGADDFVAKPFAIAELLARVRAVRRRCVQSRHQWRPLLLGPYEVNLARRTVCGGNGRQVTLTATQWAVLEVLARQPGRTIRHAHLLEQVWGPGYGSETQYLRQYVAQLRRRLEVDPRRPRHLLTEPGIGYRLEV